MSALTFRNRRGETVPVSSFSATDAKNGFGRVLETASAQGMVAITKHDETKAVLLSLDEYRALVAARSNPLDTLSAEFDGLLAGMQTPRARAGMRAAFDASPAELGKAAVHRAPRAKSLSGSARSARATRVRRG
jgi:antitoxin Phd